MQDENLKGWHKGGHGKKVQYSILGRVKSKLIKHKRVVVLDRFAPTAKFCASCGTVPSERRLWDRTFVCTCCGETIDRDVHTAGNMVYLANEPRYRVGVARTERTLGDIAPLALEALLKC